MLRTVKGKLSDAEIVDLLGRPNAMDEAIKALYRDHYDFLTGYIKSNSGNEEDAADIFQEVIIAFVGIVKNGKFKGESSIKTFLFALNRNLWLNELKRKGRALARENKYGMLSELKEVSPERFIENREASKELLNVLDTLGDSCRKILLLYYFENRTMKEIHAELTYESEQVVRNKKYKCLKKMEEMIRNNFQLYQKLKNLFNE